MQVVSVQVGSARTLPVGTRVIQTGIHKTPVDEIVLRAEGVADDAVVNTKHHGGPDQAAYVYSAEDYSWWEQQLGRSLDPGTFGENLTISTIPDGLRIGDRLRIGPVLLEVTSPRIPCATFAVRMGESNWMRRFRDADRPGFYCRVLQPGTVRPGDPCELISGPKENVSLREMVSHYYASEISIADIQHALASPIAMRSRVKYEAELSRADG